MFERITNFIRSKYPGRETIPLHEPCFRGNEKRYVQETIDSTFVSSVGKFVGEFEEMIRDFVKAECAVAAVNGTSALHMALLLAGVNEDTEVITQALTFVATANAIRYCGAEPVFIDSDRTTMGLSAEKLSEFLTSFAEKDCAGYCRNRLSGRRIAACLPMHVFGHPVQLEELSGICRTYGIALVEDAAESLGSFYRGRHTGTMGLLGVLSFNGNKIITTGGGGMILTNDRELGARAKHLTTTAKQPHAWDFVHDTVGYNYRLPNINAAVGCAQMEQLPGFVEKKRTLANDYEQFFAGLGIDFIREPADCRSNYWLNTIVLRDRKERDRFLEYTNQRGIMTRPVWRLMTDLPMYKDCQSDDLTNARWLEDRLVNIPSSVQK